MGGVPPETVEDGSPRISWGKVAGVGQGCAVPQGRCVAVRVHICFVIYKIGHMLVMKFPHYGHLGRLPQKCTNAQGTNACERQ